MDNKKIILKCNVEKEEKCIHFMGICKTYKIEGCGKETKIYPQYDIISGKEKDPWNEEYECFYWICPECGMLHKLDESLLTSDEKYTIRKECTEIQDELKELYLLKKIEKDLKKELAQFQQLKEQFEKSFYSYNVKQILKRNL